MQCKGRLMITSGDRIVSNRVAQAVAAMVAQKFLFICVRLRTCRTHRHCLTMTNMHYNREKFLK